MGKNPIWFVFWFLVFWFISFPVGFFCSFWYVVLYAFVVCIPQLSGATDALLKGVQFPHFCGQALMEGKPLF